MPTYEYRCEGCGSTFEVVQSIHDDALTTCEKCGAPLRKVYAPVGIVFKGSGFYKTDSRTSSKKASQAPKESPSADAAPREPKPAATTDTGRKDATTKDAPTDRPAAKTQAAAKQGGDAAPTKAPAAP